MEADFSGYATKANVRCSDGRTILPDAFAHQDKMKVPLVWQHGHNDPTNVLGHVFLENRSDGVWCEGFFNDTPKAQHALSSLRNKDIDSLSIWANQLAEKAQRVMHGVIREVSLVLSGANPGAKIENVTLRHGIDDYETLEEEAIIKFGEPLELKHSADSTTTTTTTVVEETVVEHAELTDETVGEIFTELMESLDDTQRDVVHFVLARALNLSDDAAEHSDILETLVHADDKAAFSAAFESLTTEQQTLLHDFMKTEDSVVSHNGITYTDQEIKHMFNVFEQNGGGVNLEHAENIKLFHSALDEIMADAAKPGATLKGSVSEWAIAHGIDDIDILFPEARALTDTPEMFGRRTEWVADLLGKVRKSPFARIKTLHADITAPEARAKGYIKGNLKKEEFFKVARRITTPTTIYKKQKLDRDDIVDITDFDVVVWLKGEMRIMLDEELARAILVGDGRDSSSDDKIDEERIRPIASDHELYTETLNVEIDLTAERPMIAVFDKLALNRNLLRGTGLPTMYTTERYIGLSVTQRDTLGHRLYRSVEELATETRVAAIVPVEILDEYPDIVAILVNPVDYVVGADRGGNVAMFDDFDIDYNQFKYLIETRCSGALVKLKSALVIRLQPTSSAEIVPTAPTFDGEDVTIVNTANVVYRNADTDVVVNAAGSPYPVAVGTTLNIVATPATGYYFESSAVDDWSFTNHE